MERELSKEEEANAERYMLPLAAIALSAKIVDEPDYDERLDAKGGIALGTLNTIQSIFGASPHLCKFWDENPKAEEMTVKAGLLLVNNVTDVYTPDELGLRSDDVLLISVTVLMEELLRLTDSEKGETSDISNEVADLLSDIADNARSN